MNLIQDFSQVYRKGALELRDACLRKEEALADYQDASSKYRRRGKPTFADFIDEVCVPGLQEELSSLRKRMSELDVIFRDGCQDLEEIIQ